MLRKEFEKLVINALNEIPLDFRNKLENVDIAIEDEPDMDTVRSMKLGSKGRLLGLYQGVPLKARAHYYGIVLPDKITLFKANIERRCREKGLDLYDEIKHILKHEIAHHFGISDRRLKEIGTY